LIYFSNIAIQNKVKELGTPLFKELI